jgi:hypothetical protein
VEEQREVRGLGSDISMTPAGNSFTSALWGAAERAGSFPKQPRFPVTPTVHSGQESWAANVSMGEGTSKGQGCQAWICLPNIWPKFDPFAVISWTF